MNSQLHAKQIATEPLNICLNLSFPTIGVRWKAPKYCILFLKILVLCDFFVSNNFFLYKYFGAMHQLIFVFLAYLGMSSSLLFSVMASLLIVIVGVMDKKEANFEDLYSSGQKGGCFF